MKHVCTDLLYIERWEGFESRTSDVQEERVLQVSGYYSIKRFSALPQHR